MCLRGESFGVVARTKFDFRGEQCDGLMNNVPK